MSCAPLHSPTKTNIGFKKGKPENRLDLNSLKSHRNLSTDLPLISRKRQQFATGSSYKGQWSILGMSGYGVYTFPNGVKYEGEFDAGEFHGDGKLIYPDGCELCGKWEYGEIQNRKLLFAKGLEYDEENWKYCKMPDRRYAVEFDNGIKPAGESYITADAPTPEIPLGMYDTGDGFYGTKTSVIHDRNDYAKIVRAPAEPERKWIEKTNRCNPMRALGPRQDLYEEWQEPLLERPDTICRRESSIAPEDMASISTEYRHANFEKPSSVSKIFRHSSAMSVKSVPMMVETPPKKRNKIYTRPSISFV